MVHHQANVTYVAGDWHKVWLDLSPKDHIDEYLEYLFDSVEVYFLMIALHALDDNHVKAVVIEDDV